MTQFTQSDRDYGKFSARKHNIFAFSGSSDARFLLMIWPALENSLSEGVLVAGMHSILLAAAAIAGKRLRLSSSHSYSLSCLVPRSVPY